MSTIRSIVKVLKATEKHATVLWTVALTVSLVILLSPTAYAGSSTTINVTPSFGVSIKRSPMFYLRRTPMLTYPVIFLGEVVFSRIKKKRDIGQIIVRGWILFGVTSFLVTTLGLFDILPSVRTFVYLGAYFITCILSVLSLGYIATRNNRKKEGNEKEVETQSTTV